MNIDMKKTGIRLQKFAKLYGYSVKEIQEYLGFSCPQSIYRWYKGMILPSIDNLLRLSELYHVHMEELLVKEMRDNIYYYRMEFSDIDKIVRRMNIYYTSLAA